MRRSPSLSTSAPLAGAAAKRARANALMMALAAWTPTLKLAAYWGSTGATRPKPMETQKAALTRIQISRGMGVRDVGIVASMSWGGWLGWVVGACWWVSMRCG